MLLRVITPSYCSCKDSSKFIGTLSWPWLDSVSASSTKGKHLCGYPGKVTRIPISMEAHSSIFTYHIISNGWDTDTVEFGYSLKRENPEFKVFRSFQVQTHGKPDSLHILQLNSIHNWLNTNAERRTQLSPTKPDTLTTRQSAKRHCSSRYAESEKYGFFFSKFLLFIFVCDGVIVLFSELNMVKIFPLLFLTCYQ